jgi:hypothetical protein
VRACTYSNSLILVGDGLPMGASTGRDFISCDTSTGQNEVVVIILLDTSMSLLVSLIELEEVPFLAVLFFSLK